MANLWSGQITNSKYEEFSTISEVTLTDDTKYSIQILGGARLCESATQPEDDEGFLIKDDRRPFGFTKKSGVDLYVRAVTGYCTLNIAE